jgi:hypothetical protein
VDSYQANRNKDFGEQQVKVDAENNSKWTKNPNAHFSKEDTRTANEHVKRCLVAVSHGGNAKQNHHEILFHTHQHS